MPGMDRSGPLGQGPATGRRMGGCAGSGAGMGFASGRGMGAGRGRGRRGAGRGLRNGFRAVQNYSAEETRDQMEERLAFLKNETEDLENRLRSTAGEG